MILLTEVRTIGQSGFACRPTCRSPCKPILALVALATIDLVGDDRTLEF